MFNEHSHPKKRNISQSYLSSCVYYLEHRNQSQNNLKRKHEECVKNSDVTSSTSATSPAKRPKVAGWHVKLATETPPRTDLDTDLEDGYSTVHDIETGKCPFSSFILYWKTIKLVTKAPRGQKLFNKTRIVGQIIVSRFTFAFFL